MDQSGVLLWVKAEPFIVGALQEPPPSKLSLHYLKKVAAYVRTRATERAYPRLYWPTWRHIACGKLQLAKDLAWLYFEIFDNLSERTPEERLEWSEILSNCTTKDEVEKQRNQLSVDTLQFLLFLYIQQLNKISLRTSLIGEEWPSPRNRPKSPSPAERSSCHNKNWNDYNHQAFVCDHLSELLELLLDPEQLTESFHSTQSSLLSREAVTALSFLIEGTVSRTKKVYPLHELALWQPLHAANGFSKISKTFSLYKLEAWLRACLTTNPFGLSACLQSGKKLAWAHKVEGATKRAKIACNAHMAPRSHRIVVMSQVCNQTLAKSSETLVGAHVRAHRCNESFIYLLSPLRSMTIEKCRNSTFVLGPVETALHLHGWSRGSSSRSSWRTSSMSGWLVQDIDSSWTASSHLQQPPTKWPKRTSHGAMGLWRREEERRMVSAQACWKGILATHETSSFSLSKSFCWFLSVLTSDFHKSTLLWKVRRSRVVRKWNSGQGSSVCTLVSR